MSEMLPVKYGSMKNNWHYPMRCEIRIKSLQLNAVYDVGSVIL